MCDGEGKLDPLESLLAAIGQFRTTPVELTPFELGERLIRLRHGIEQHPPDARVAGEALHGCGRDREAELEEVSARTRR
jgi:hypothetical protein